MSRRQFIVSFLLLAIAATASAMAARIWRQHERAQVARAALPTPPALTRWPAELAAELEKTSAEVQAAADPQEPLGRLAERYLANGFDAEASRALEGLRRLDPRSARWVYLQAELQRRRGDRAACEQALEQTVALDPTYAPAWLRLGDARRERGVFDGAEECYVQASANAPGDVRATFALIAFEAQHGKRTDPRHSLVELVQDWPGIWELHDLLARLHAAAGDPASAAEQRRLAAQARRHLSTEDPWLDGLEAWCCDPEQLQRLARRHDREGRMLAAEKLLKRAIRLAPAESAPRKWLARFFEDNDRVPEARKLLETAVADFPDDPELPVRLAEALVLEHKPFEAVAGLRPALARRPAQAALHAALGRAWREARETEEAVPPLREAIRLDATQVEARYDLAFCLLGLKQRDEGRALAEQALAMRPDYPEALVLLGGIALEDGAVEQAEKLVLRLHELQPDEPGSQILYGALYLAKGQRLDAANDLNGAAGFYATGLSVAPQFAPLLREAALLAARRAQYQEVVDFWERYLRIVPKDLEAYLLLAGGYRETEQPELLERTLERGLEMARKARDRAKQMTFAAQLDAL